MPKGFQQVSFFELLIFASELYNANQKTSLKWNIFVFFFTFFHTKQLTFTTHLLHILTELCQIHKLTNEKTKTKTINLSLVGVKAQSSFVKAVHCACVLDIPHLIKYFFILIFWRLPHINGYNFLIFHSIDKLHPAKCLEKMLL